MKWMIASDLHGSLTYTKQLFARMEQEAPQKLLLLGDLLYHGPRNDLPEGYDPKGVLALLNAHKEKLLCVRGNCDCEVDQMVLQFPILADYAILWLGERLIFATHGHVHNLENLPPLEAGTVLLHGHTHIPAIQQQDGIWYLNPGSVSIPKAGSCHSYMTWEDGVFTLRDLADGCALSAWDSRQPGAEA